MVLREYSGAMVVAALIIYMQDYTMSVPHPNIMLVTTDDQNAIEGCTLIYHDIEDRKADGSVIQVHAIVRHEIRGATHLLLECSRHLGLIGRELSNIWSSLRDDATITTTFSCAVRGQICFHKSFKTGNQLAKVC
jgi:hypothetical protein